jgi:hypothetical protein
MLQVLIVARGLAHRLWPWRSQRCLMADSLANGPARDRFWSLACRARQPVGRM